MLFEGVNIIFTGDGFVDKDMGTNRQDSTYETVMKKAVQAFFSIEPTKSYREYFNVYIVKAVSKNEGFEAKSQTVFNSKWGKTSPAWGFDSNRSQCKNYALEVPHINLQETPIIIIFNTPRHAGGITYLEESREALTFCARNKLDPDNIVGIVLHEGVGHALGRLADE